MKILILEDDFQHQKRISRALEQMGGFHKQDIFLTSSPDKIIAEAEKTSEGNIYFLDLEIAGEKQAGFHTAVKIREKDLFGVIAFITTHSEMAPVTFEYQVSALDFIPKDLTYEQFANKLSSCLEKALKQIETLRNEFDYFSFQNKYCSFQLPFHEILYFETGDIPHKTRVVTNKKEMEFYADLKEIEKLDDRLFRCHRSYIVNIEQIREVDRKERVLDLGNGVTCLLSRKYLKLLLETLNTKT